MPAYENTPPSELLKYVTVFKNGSTKLAYSLPRWHGSFGSQSIDSLAWLRYPLDGFTESWKQKPPFPVDQ